MAHYAFLNEENVVTEVITGIDETELIEGKEPEVWYSEFRGQVCKRTSFNGNIRKVFAGIGFKYDEQLDIFIPEQPFNSWIFDKKAHQWIPPTQYPSDGRIYTWNEDNVNWSLLND